LQQKLISKKEPEMKPEKELHAMIHSAGKAGGDW